MTRTPPGATHLDHEGEFWLIETRAFLWIPPQVGVLAGGWTEASALLKQSRAQWPNFPNPLDNQRTTS